MRENWRPLKSKSDDIKRAKTLTALLDQLTEMTMAKRIKAADLPDFDAARYLDCDAAVAAYLTDILEANDPALLAAALGGLARARGMSEIANASGLMVRKARGLGGEMDEKSDLRPLSELFDRYCAVWSEPSASVRGQLLAQVWAPDATYTDPTVHAATSSDLLAHIDKVLARRPGAKVVRTSAVDAHHGIARFSWRVVQADGSALPDGLDIAELTSDARRIKRIVGFFGPLRGL